MRLLLIVNSAASSVTVRSRVVIQKALGADHEVSVVETSRRGHAVNYALDAATRGLDAVVVLGGDGTLNEAANGLAGTACALAPLPGGSTNVFARTLGYPNDPIEATGVLLEALARGQFRRVGVGNLNGRRFLFHAGIGFDAAVVREVEARGTLKRWAGHPLFVYAALRTLARGYDRRHPHFAVKHADGTVVNDGYFTIVLNTNPYTFLGNRALDVAPEATLERSLVCITVRSLNLRSALLLVRAGLLGHNELLRQSKWVDYRSDVEQVTIVGHAPFPHQVDGDYLGETERLEISYDPSSLNLVVPVGN